MLRRDAGDKYSTENTIPRMAGLVKKFNELMPPVFKIQILVGLHQKRQLWWINKEGVRKLVRYKTIPTGSEAVANRWLADFL